MTEDLNRQIGAQENIQTAKIPGTNSPIFDLKERTDAFIKENALVNQANAARQAFFLKDQQLNEKSIVDVEKLGDEYASLAEKIALAQGNDAAAAAISTERADRDLRRRLQHTVDTGSPEESAGAQQQLDDQAQLAKTAVLQGSLASEARKYGDTLADLGVANAHLDNQSQTGLMSEIDLLTKKADIAKQYIPLLQAEIDAQQKLADSLPSGVLKDETLQKIAQEKLQIEQLGIAADGLKNKFDSTITDNFTTALDAIVDRTKSVKDAFKDMGKSIEQTITHMVDEQLSKQLYQALFGATGAIKGDVSLAGRCLRVSLAAAGALRAAGAESEAGFPACSVSGGSSGSISLSDSSPAGV